MWSKIKNYLIIIGASVSVVLFTVIVLLTRRSSADGGRSRADNERDSRITDGLGRSSEQLGRSQERLQRAEEILRNAVERSRKEKRSAKDNNDCQ